MSRALTSRAAALEQLTQTCLARRLPRVAQTLPTLLEQAAQQELSYSDFLQQVLATEAAAKQEKHTAMRIQMARFPFQKTLEHFDWKTQPSVEPKVIKQLATMRFVADGANVLLLGPPGVGKTDLSVALGMEACRHALRVGFTTVAALITILGKAPYENRLEERLKRLTQEQLLIIDEIGYTPIDRQGANPFFQLVSRRYERGAILLTSNQSLSAWVEVFGDAVIASAILDRLLHHATTVNIKGDSYRLREKRKAGLVGSRLAGHPVP